MNSAKQNLSRYLATEKLLNNFFDSFNFCYEKCVKIEIEKNQGEPVAACCQNKYYKLYDLDHPAFELLKLERESLYGRPEDHSFKNPVSPCDYHNPYKGCVVKTHKSPICLSFMCRESIDELRDKYKIFEYDYLGVNYALEWILTGDFSEKDFIEFTQSIIDMQRKITGK